MLWSHNNKNQYFCNIIKSRCGSCGSGRIGASTDYRPALVIGAKVLPHPRSTTSTGRVKSIRGGVVRDGSVQNCHPHSPFSFMAITTNFVESVRHNCIKWVHCHWTADFLLWFHVYLPFTHAPCIYSPHCLWFW